VEQGAGCVACLRSAPSHRATGSSPSCRSKRPHVTHGRPDLGPQLRVPIDQPRLPRVTCDTAIEILFTFPVELSIFSLIPPRVGKRADWRRYKEERDYAALRAAGAFTDFARSLAEVIGDSCNTLGVTIAATMPLQ
jgi:hypothetical protein